MKKLMALFLTCALCLTGCGVAGMDSSETLETVPVLQALPMPNLYIEIPGHFEVTSSQFYEEYYICEDASIIVTQDTEAEAGISLEDYAVNALVQYQNVTTSLEVTNDELIYAGENAVQILEFIYTVGEGDAALSMHCMAGYLSDGESVYILTCKSNVDTYERFRSDFRSVMDSVSFVK